MIPIQKIKDIITKHDILEKELASGSLDSKLFAKKSKEYSNLGGIISVAKEYINYPIFNEDLNFINKSPKLSEIRNAVSD